jgi:excisionase family DNA binding protein
MTDTEWWTRREAAAYLRVKERTIDQYVREDRLQRYRIAGTRTARFKAEDVRALVVPNGEHR